MRNVDPVLQGLGELQRIPEALRFEIASRAPALAQRRQLAAIVRGVKDTALGRDLRVDDVRTLRDLQRRVPVQGYADVAPYVARQLAGEERVLTRERPVFFAQSTGTTGAPKLTPATPSYRRDFQRTVHVSMAQVALRFPRAFTGQVLYFVGPRDLDRAPSGAPIGYTSGFNFLTMPQAVRRLYAWPYELFLVRDLDARTYLAALLAVQANVTFCAAIFPNAVLHLLRCLEELAEPLARDLARGELRDDLALTGEQRAFFSGLVRRDPALAGRLLGEARSHGGRLPVAAALPSLRLVYCWTSGSAGYYVPELRERLGGGVAVRDAIYASNEAWANVTFGEDEPGGPVALESAFYEFVEEGAWDRGVREGVGAEALEPGMRYRILVTTRAGLLRYDVGDIVECTGRYHATPRICFARRAGASLNLAGEKLDESHVTAAVGKVLARMGLLARFFTAVPRPHPRPRWEIAIELEREVSDDLLEELRGAVDLALGEAAIDYAAYRRTALAPAALRVIARGEFERQRRALVARGGQDAQLKVVHLQVDPEWLSGWHMEKIVEARQV